MKDLESRADVGFLVNAFYTKVRADEMLGPIFNGIIKEWDLHIELLTDFWETNLFFKRKYKGNPLHVHINVDRAMSGNISQEHFGRWIMLWYETIDTHFVGEKANAAKNRARNMATTLFVHMYKSRKTEME